MNKYRRTALAHIESLSNKLENPSGFPQNALINISKQYENIPLSAFDIKKCADGLVRYLELHGKSTIIHKMIHRPTNSFKKSVHGLLVGVLIQKQYTDNEKCVFMCNSVTSFSKKDFYLLSTFDPMFTTTHLYHRLMQRTSLDASEAFASLYQITDLWPFLLQFGNYRKIKYKKADLNYFFNSYSNGLIFSEFQKSEIKNIGGLRPEIDVLHLKSPVASRKFLKDPLSDDQFRTLVMIKTFVSGGELKPHQAELVNMLEKFKKKNAKILEYYNLKFRFGITSDVPKELHLMELFCSEPEQHQVSNAFQEFDEIVASPPWQTEMSFQKS